MGNPEDRHAGAGAQQDALRPDHAGHHHRRRRGDRHGGHRPGRAEAGAGADRRAWAPTCSIVSRQPDAGGVRTGWRRHQDPDRGGRGGHPAGVPGGGGGGARGAASAPRWSTGTRTGAPAPGHRRRSTSTSATGRSLAASSSPRPTSRSAANVAVIGETVRENLFGDVRSGGPDHPHQQPPVQGGGRAGGQGQSAHGPGPGRRASSPTTRAEEARSGRTGCDHPSWSRREPRCATRLTQQQITDCCASATASARRGRRLHRPQPGGHGRHGRSRPPRS